MTAVSIDGEVVVLPDNWRPGVERSSVNLYDAFNYDYAAMYRMQPNVRTCVEFLGRNIAQLGLHVFRRVSDTDRERLIDHPLAGLLSQPLPPKAKITYYRMIESLVNDLGIYFNAYWLKLRQDGQVKGLLRLPPIYVSVHGSLVPRMYELNLGLQRYEIDPDEVVHIRGYNPENPIFGLSPLETLRRILAEEHAAGNFRENFWQNAARKEGIVERPNEAPEWSSDARERFRAEFQELYSGGSNSGKVIVLEEGMTWQDVSFNAQESEYLEGRKLTREECARAYHIPLPMVGILDHATLTNIREQHKNLYQDSLGPWLAMIEQDTVLQLLPEFDDSKGVYVEFNIMEKLQGSFEEQTQSLQAAVGRPWMTANEARSRMNLPRDPDPSSDRLVVPLNVLVGGQASPQDSAPPKGLHAKQFDSYFPDLRQRHEQKWVEVLTRHYKRQESAIVSRVPKSAMQASHKTDIGGVWWDDERWNTELAEDLLRLNNLTATTWARSMVDQVGAEIEDWDAFDARMLPWLQEHSRIQAEYINSQTRDAVGTALLDQDPLSAVKDVFILAATVWALRQAVSAVTSASSFGSHEAASASGLGKKTWHVRSSNPRPSHSAQNGLTVGIRDLFPNGLRWPGDPRGSADENANCQCTVSFS